MLHRISLLLVMVWLLAACVSTQASRGYVLSEEALASLTVGESGRMAVLQALGSPSSASDFEIERWHYVSKVVERTSVLSPDLVDQQILSMEFDENGILSKVSKKTVDDAREVDISERTTPTRGHTVGMVEQLIGNFGRFNAPVDTEGQQ